MSSTGRGTNTSRRMLSPSTSGVQEELHVLRTERPGSFLQRAVVVEVLCEPGQLSEEQLSTLKQTVSNPDTLDRAPRNTLVVRIVSEAADRRGNSPLICYPLLSSHLELPVKPGEQIFVLYENPSAEGGLPYWLCKIGGQEHVEDANYTHLDRQLDRTTYLKTSDRAAGMSPSDPAFPNGAGTPASYTLNGVDDYESIVEASSAYQLFTPEPVPRFSKRPGDTVLQGSNNTLIVLGQDRLGTVASTVRNFGAGAIDLVVGRTVPATVANSRGFQETDKNKPNTSEGAPDHLNDRTRLALYQKTDGDQNFGFLFPQSFRGSTSPVSGLPFLVAKSDEIRLVARQTGSVRLVKEGSQSGDGCSFLLLPDGTAQIDADIIFIGRATAGTGPGPRGSEPYIKFSKYKEHLSTLITEINTLLNAFTVNFNLPVAAPGTPHPGLVASLPNIATTQANLEALKVMLDQAQSDKIFGE